MGNNQQTSDNACRPVGYRLGVRGFTLLEMMLAITVIAVLSTLTVVAVSKVKSQAESVRSVTAAKTLINAVHSYNAEHGGQYFPGRDETAGKSEYTQVTYQGRVLPPSQTISRYPFRLAPYLNDDFNGSIWVGGNYEQITSIPVFSGDFLDYGISLFPAFGINEQMVGGIVDSAPNVQHFGTEKEAVTHVSQLETPLIAFASAGQKGVNYGSTKHKIINGYFYITPPYANMGSNWQGSKWRNTSDPAGYGNLDARADGKVTVAFTDGSVQLMEVEEMRDMRLWSRNAARLNDPFYNPRLHR